MSASYVSLLHLLGDEARRLALAYFRTGIDVTTKADESPVTIADREIERRLRELILERFPGHNVVGEEEGGTIKHGTNWVIDPIDGTKSFISGIPLFGTLVAVIEEGMPTFGMIEVPVLNERWIGDCKQATLNGSPSRVSNCKQLRDARLCTTDPSAFADGQSAAFARLARCVGVSRFGTDCYGYALLASGHVDLVVEAQLEAYDVMALAPVIQGSGGVVTTWSGAPLSADFDGTILAASTAELHGLALEALSAANG